MSSSSFWFGLSTGIAVASIATFSLETVKALIPLYERKSTETYEKTVEKLESLFVINQQKAQEIYKHFIYEMNQGLKSDDHALKMIPSYVTNLPTGAEKGNFLALDMGGSNFRVCQVQLEGSHLPIRMNQKKYVISEPLKVGPGKDLFNFFADCVYEFLKEFNGLDTEHLLGFTFSFPCSQSSIDEGKLIKWTKGFTCPGVEGEDPVALLSEAFSQKGLKIHVKALVNDTVGCLISASYLNPSTYVGVILGTGSNAAYVEKIENIPKYRGPPAPSGQMVINMEWGAFDTEGTVLPATRYDVRLDRASPNPKFQPFEKMISGMYLGELVRLVMVDLVSTGELFAALPGKQSAELNVAYSFDTANMSRIERDHSLELSDVKTVLSDYLHTSTVSYADCRIVKRICELIGTRSARLSAIGIAAIITKLNNWSECTVGVDGSLFEHYPHYGNRMRDTLRELVGLSSNNISLVQARDGSGQGAALIAALAD